MMPDSAIHASIVRNGLVVACLGEVYRNNSDGLAGGTTLAVAKALIQRGVIKSNESVVVCITGNGYKTAEVMRDRVDPPVTIGRKLSDFEQVVAPQTVSA